MPEKMPPSCVERRENGNDLWWGGVARGCVPMKGRRHPLTPCKAGGTARARAPCRATGWPGGRLLQDVLISEMRSEQRGGEPPRAKGEGRGVHSSRKQHLSASWCRGGRLPGAQFRPCSASRPHLGQTPASEDRPGGRGAGQRLGGLELGAQRESRPFNGKRQEPMESDSHPTRKMNLACSSFHVSVMGPGGFSIMQPRPGTIRGARG